MIGFEQRGCGRSTPHASDPSTDLSVNTTAHLVADIERLREHLGVDAWIVNGVSWGSTLALAYTQAHPDRVTGVVVYAVTAGSRRETDWITEGIGAIFPEAWDRFAWYAERCDPGFRRGEDSLVAAYARMMASPDPGVRDRATWEWARWEDTHVSIATGGVHRDPRWDDPAFRHAFVRLATHYWSNDCFCDPPLLEGMATLADIPAVLVHGRRDVSSPVVTAWELQRRWPGARLVVVEGTGTAA
ncbi:alpha/beta fold hydrolase [Nocardioides sambongensis]|uniref:alpha/beta fold hydrolase n=1 Tax=Nocardioides sambongensis TaxID=2589074 RepID=UPI001E3072D4|nr:alpha/beta fold hydrolase [Nocardioides sambongensis]